MEVNVADQGSHVLAKTSGAINDEAADPIREQLDPVVSRDEAVLIIDISDSARINSAGLAILVRLVTDANKYGSRMILAAPSDFVANVLDVTKLSEFFEVAATVDAAVKMLEE